MTRDDVRRVLSMKGLRDSLAGFVAAGKLWPAAMMSTQYFQVNRVGAVARIEFKHLKLVEMEGMTEPEPLEMVEFASFNEKREGQHRLFKALCCPHVDPTVCPVWFLAAQLVGMHTRMPGIIQSVVDGDMTEVSLPDFVTRGSISMSQPLWWGYSLYPAGNGSGGGDPARGQISEMAINVETRHQLDLLPEWERPYNTTHSTRYGGLGNLQTNGCTREQCLKKGGWTPEQQTMMDRYGICLMDVDACMRAGGHVPRNGEPPKNHHVRPLYWPGLRDKLVKAGYEKEVETLEQGIFPCLDAAIEAVAERDRLADADKVHKDRNAMPFLRLLRYLRGVFLAGAWAILEIRDAKPGGKQLPCFGHPVFLGEHMSVDPDRPSWVRGKLCRLAREDAEDRRRWRSERTPLTHEALGRIERKVEDNMRLAAMGKRGAAAAEKVRVQAAAASASPPAEDLPLVYAAPGTPQVVQWQTKLQIRGIWAKWDGEFRGVCRPGTTSLDPGLATWDKSDGKKKAGTNFNEHIKATVRYMDQLVGAEMQRHKTRAEAAAIVIPALEEVGKELGMPVSTFCEAVYLLARGKTGSRTKNCDVGLLGQALTKAPRWLSLPVA
ncbi:hypothetical protein WJX74_010111 [Apatococcus lobatus]|uniref:Uncharacterized protein n=1 Tax=Apatococcus lobatus TaxID=904363 RepID=A0AAW1R124_9CHLO